MESSTDIHPHDTVGVGRLVVPLPIFGIGSSHLRHQSMTTTELCGLNLPIGSWIPFKVAYHENPCLPIDEGSIPHHIPFWLCVDKWLQTVIVLVMAVLRIQIDDFITYTLSRYGLRMTARVHRFG